MPNFTPDELEHMLHDVLDRVAAPRRSAKWLSAPDIMQPLFENGDEGDHYVFMTGLANALAYMLGLDKIQCPCGDPTHKPEKIFILRDHEDPTRPIPPEVETFAELVSAEASDDEEGSMVAWVKAARGGYADKMMAFALSHVGDTLREVVAMQGSN